MEEVLSMVSQLLEPQSFLSPRNISILAQLTISFAVVFFIMFLKIWVPDIGRQAPFLLFTTAIILCGWYAGFAASISVSLLSSILVSFVFISPFGILNNNPANSVEAGLFLVESFFLSIAVEYVKRIREMCLQRKQLSETLMNAVSSHGIILLDEQNCIIDWNIGAQKIFGYKKEEILGKPLCLICDKKSWFNANNDPLYLRVMTKMVYSTARKVELRIKIVRKVADKKSVSNLESISPPIPFSQEILPSPQVL